MRLRRFHRLFAIIGLILAVALTAGVLFTRTATFNGLLREKLNGYLAATYKGQITVGRIDGSIWGHLILRDLSVHYDNASVLTTPYVRIDYSLIPLLWRRVHASILIVDPAIRVAKNLRGEWGVLDAFAAKETGPPSAVEMFLDHLAIRNASIEILPHGSAAPGYVLRNVELAGKGAFLTKGSRFQITSLTTRVEAKGFPAVQVTGALSYQDTAAPASLEISQLTVATVHSSASLEGRLRYLKAPELHATMLVSRLSPADVVRILPAYPIKQDLSGKVTIDGPEDALHARALIKAGKGKFHGDAKLSLGKPGGLRYAATFKALHLDVAELFEKKAYSGVLEMDGDVAGAGISVPQLRASLKMKILETVLGGVKLGQLSVAGVMKDSKLDFTGESKGDAGRLGLTGKTTVSENPKYSAKLMAEHLNLKAAALTGQTSDLNFNVAVDGTGVALSRTKATFREHTSPSRVGRFRLGEGDIVARLDDGRVRVSQATAQMQGTALRLAGQGGISSGSATVEYGMRAKNLGPWLTLAGYKGTGSLDATGHATINLGNLDFHTQGTVVTRQVHVDSYATRSAKIGYDIGGSGRQIPYGHISGDFTGVRLGPGFRKLTVSIKAKPTMPRVIDVAIDARDEAGRTHVLAAQLTPQERRISGSLTNLKIALPSGVWRLGRRSAFAVGSGAASIGNLELRNGDRRISLDGTLSVAGHQDFALRVSRLNFDALHPLIRSAPKLRGRLSGEIKIKGTSAAPVVDIKLNATGLRMEAVRIGDVAATVGYQNRAAAVDMTLSQDPGHRLTVTGSVPLVLSWVDGLKARVQPASDLRVRSAGLSLAPLDAIKTFISGLSGSVAMDIAVSGPLWHPVATGELRVAGAKGLIVPLGVRLSEARMRAKFQPGKIHIAELWAQSGGGTLSGTATVGTDALATAPIDVEVNLRQWPTIATHRYEATVSGRLVASGTMNAPRIEGVLDLLRGTIRPDLAFLTEGSRYSIDKTIEVVPAHGSEPGSQARAQKSPAPPKNPGVPATPVGGFNAMAMDLAVKIHRDTWIRHPQAATELEGMIHFTKKPGAGLVAVGKIRTVRGWVNFQQRRFTLASGVIAFTGSRPIDPSLDIDARYRLPGYVIDVIAGGTARKPTLRLASQPELSQTDILSLLLFGKTVSALGGSQRADLRQQAAKMAASYATSQVGGAVSQILGLQGLGIGLSDVSTSGATVGFGRYATENTYVSASTEVGGMYGQKVSVQYYLTKWLSVVTSTSSDGSREIDLNISKHY